MTIVPLGVVSIDVTKCMLYGSSKPSGSTPSGMDTWEWPVKNSAPPSVLCPGTRRYPVRRYGSSLRNDMVPSGSRPS